MNKNTNFDTLAYLTKLGIKLKATINGDNGFNSFYTLLLLLVGQIMPMPVLVTIN